MFTLAHELAHAWLGQEGEGLSGFDSIFPGDGRIEKFCNQAAAEFLVPAEELKRRWPTVKTEAGQFGEMARYFKVSPVVIGRRAMDLQLVHRDVFFEFYSTHMEQQKARQSQGGDFYKNQSTRIGEQFAIAVIRAAMAGRLSFKEAYSLTDLHGGTFQSYAVHLGFPL